MRPLEGAARIGAIADPALERSHRRIDAVAADDDDARFKRAVVSFFAFGTKNFWPALMSATVAGANITTSVLGGTMTFFSPSLYFIDSFWPSLLTTALSTLALVIVLFGMRSHG